MKMIDEQACDEFWFRTRDQAYNQVAHQASLQDWYQIQHTALYQAWYHARSWELAEFKIRA